MQSKCWTSPSPGCPPRRWRKTGGRVALSLITLYTPSLPPIPPSKHSDIYKNEMKIVVQNRFPHVKKTNINYRLEVPPLSPRHILSPHCHSESVVWQPGLKWAAPQRQRWKYFWIPPPPHIYQSFLHHFNGVQHANISTAFQLVNNLWSNFYGNCLLQQ